jgi:hypothetical protein
MTTQPAPTVLPADNPAPTPAGPAAGLPEKGPAQPDPEESSPNEQAPGTPRPPPAGGDSAAVRPG